jgi:hypothetical protein
MLLNRIIQGKISNGYGKEIKGYGSPTEDFLIILSEMKV